MVSAIRLTSAEDQSKIAAKPAQQKWIVVLFLILLPIAGIAWLAGLTWAALWLLQHALR